ncbi:MAG TPA: bifunctional phosphoribosyl-AMP cyclohydrolase/phosphoribosyl-ATP diphosphatase HisIE [Acidobacteriota bacterium]|nr:bifunctional phosphoribosyl-AMP cyclohydrolase/phosphoribosyl-ATP diphosphatase HisIE [Acidobacteriota bacterium]
MTKSLINTLAWDKMNGLIPAVVQDARTGRVLMLAYMNRDALQKTLDTNQVTFYSRSRAQLWTKGETSGNTLTLIEIRPDCDNDAVLVIAEPAGPTCHTGRTSCFGQDADHTALESLGELDRLIQQRHRDRPPDSYTTTLFEAGLAKMAQKVGEEAVEVVVSALEEESRTIEESADLLYHLTVLLRSRGLSLTDVATTLSHRRHPK